MRKTFIENVHRLVIKIGTNSIMLPNNRINFRKLDRLALVVASLIREGKEILLVSSGAVGVGAAFLRCETYPQSIADQQAVAAVGQGILMGHYGRLFQFYNVAVGQILLTRDVVDFPQSYQNVRQALATMLRMGILPIINENDTVAVDELNHMTKFGDNDTLSAIVAGISEADLLIILSDVAGLYERNPREDPQASFIPLVHDITPEIVAMANGKGSTFATGGMATKLEAGRRILNQGQAMLIMSGADPNDLFRVFEGEEVGTLFIAK